MEKTTYFSVAFSPTQHISYFVILFDYCVVSYRLSWLFWIFSLLILENAMLIWHKCDGWTLQTCVEAFMEISSWLSTLFICILSLLLLLFLQLIRLVVFLVLACQRFSAYLYPDWSTGSFAMQKANDHSFFLVNLVGLLILTHLVQAGLTSLKPMKLHQFLSHENQTLQEKCTNNLEILIHTGISRDLYVEHVYL